MRKKVISEVLLRTSKATLSPPESGALSNPHALSSLPRLLAPARLLLLAGEWGWSPGERLQVPTVLPGGHRGQMGKLWPLGLWPPECGWPPQQAPWMHGDGVCVCVLAELGSLLLHFRLPAPLP